MFDVSALEHDSTSLFISISILLLGIVCRLEREKRELAYHLWSSDFQNRSVSLSQCCFAAHHIGTVAEHGNADKWIAICMPIDDRIIVLSRNGVLAFFDLGWYRNVDVAYFPVHGRDKIDASDI